MDGITLLDRLSNRLNEGVYSEFMDTKLSYEYLNDGAIDLVGRTQCLRATTTITTVSGQAAYDLPTDYLNLSLYKNGEKFIQFTHDSNVSIVKFKGLNEVVYENQTDTVDVPSYFTLADNIDLPDRVSGTASVAGTASNGECALTNPTVSEGDLDDVVVGDVVHNLTDSSSGYVIAKSGTTLTCALFDGSTNQWAESDEFIVQPEGREQIIFSQPPADSGDTITVQYIQRPTPVYSPYRSFRFKPQYNRAIIFYAAWLYKFKDREPRFADAFYREYEKLIGLTGESIKKARNTNRVQVSLKGRK